MYATYRGTGDSSQSGTTSGVDTPLYGQAEKKLQELIQQGNLEAIELALKMRPQKSEMTC